MQMQIASPELDACCINALHALPDGSSVGLDVGNLGPECLQMFDDQIVHAHSFLLLIGYQRKVDHDDQTTTTHNDEGWTLPDILKRSKTELQKHAILQDRQ
jgi:hypothetical protein